MAQSPFKMANTLTDVEVPPNVFAANTTSPPAPGRRRKSTLPRRKPGKQDVEVDDRTKESTQFRPHPTTSITVERKKYSTSLDPRGYIPVYEYAVNSQPIMWDRETGYVHFTGIWKALGKNKADIARLVDTHPDLAMTIKKVRGGFLKIQGTWMPFESAKELSRRTCYHLREQLVPLFGPNFPNSTLDPNQPGFGRLVLSDEAAQKKRLRRKPKDARPVISAPGNNMLSDKSTLKSSFGSCDNAIPVIDPSALGHHHPGVSTNTPIMMPPYNTGNGTTINNAASLPGFPGPNLMGKNYHQFPHYYEPSSNYQIQDQNQMVSHETYGHQNDPIPNNNEWSNYSETFNQHKRRDHEQDLLADVYEDKTRKRRKPQYSDQNQDDSHLFEVSPSNNLIDASTRVLNDGGDFSSLTSSQQRHYPRDDRSESNTSGTSSKGSGLLTPSAPVIGEKCDCSRVKRLLTRAPPSPIHPASAAPPVPLFERELYDAVEASTILQTMSRDDGSNSVKRLPWPRKFIMGNQEFQYMGCGYRLVRYW